MLFHKINLNNLKRQYRLVQSFTFMAAMTALAFLPFTARAVDGTFSLGGDAVVVNNTPVLGHPKAFQLPSTCTGECLRGERFGQLTTSSVIYMPDHTLQLKDLSTLSTDYRRIEGDCGGGSPRFEIALDTNGDGEIDGRVFVYLGPQYNYVGCSKEWESSGDLTNSVTWNRWDITQFRGPFYTTYRDTVNWLGEAYICYIILVVDGSWYPYPAIPNPLGKQIFQVDRVRVNNDIFNASQALSATKLTGPTLTRLALENYVTGIAAPQSIFSQDNFLGRRYSLRTLLRMMGQTRSTQGRAIEGR